MIDFLMKKADYDSASEGKNVALIRILIFAGVLACFTHFNAARAVIGLIAITFLALPETRKHFFDYRGSKLICLFLFITGTVAAINLNVLGFLAALMCLGMLIFANTARAYMTPKFFESIIDFICAGSVFAGIYCIIEFIVMRQVDADYRSMAWFPNPNFYAATVMLVITLCAYKVTRLGWKAWPYILVAFLNAAGLYTSMSMSLWLVALIAVTILLICTRKYGLLALLWGAVAVVVVLIFTKPELFERITHIGGTTRNRVKIWKFAIEQYKEVPLFGRGFFSYHHLYEKYHEVRKIFKASLCHSIYLDSMLCHGICGTALAGTFFFRYLQDLAAARRGMKAKGLHRPITGMLIGIFIALACYGLIDTTLVWIQGGTILLLLAAGGLGVEEKLIKE